MQNTHKTWLSNKNIIQRYRIWYFPWRGQNNCWLAAFSSAHSSTNYILYVYFFILTWFSSVHYTAIHPSWVSALLCWNIAANVESNKLADCCVRCPVCPLTCHFFRNPTYFPQCKCIPKKRVNIIIVITCLAPEPVECSGRRRAWTDKLTQKGISK